MGRLPCCDKGVKKGPWTPEEDIILVSYIQEHGPANWRAIPTNTGLSRCSKSCRLRWTNYLRPGIKRGNFTKQEDKIIIHLQALLGNRWAAIASYLPERTDNDIKNYWNTYLKKRLQKLESRSERSLGNNVYNNNSDSKGIISRGQWERRLQTDINMAKKALTQALSPNDDNSSIISNDIGSIKPITNSSVCYASSADNIARLLKGWMNNPPNKKNSSKSNSIMSTTQNSFNNLAGIIDTDNSEGAPSVGAKGSVELYETFESLFGYESLDYSSNSDLSHEASTSTLGQDESKPGTTSSNIAEMPFSLLEKWLLDDTKFGAGANLF